jgi:tryptophanyl-tRNA synthetase
MCLSLFLRELKTKWGQERRSTNIITISKRKNDTATHVEKIVEGLREQRAAWKEKINKQIEIVVQQVLYSSLDS